MAYLQVYHRPAVYTGPEPRIVCPHYTALGKENCINCSFRGVPLMAEINSYLLLLLKRERNTKKISYLNGLDMPEDKYVPMPKYSKLGINTGKVD